MNMIKPILHAASGENGTQESIFVTLFSVVFVRVTISHAMKNRRTLQTGLRTEACSDPPGKNRNELKPK